jgi:hypothetical protein
MPPAAFVGSLPLAKDRPVMVLDLKPTSEALGLEIKGCLGMDFLSQYVVRIDFDQGRLALSRTPGRDAGQAVPLQIGGGRAFVEANVFGTGPANSFLIDTGDIGLGSGRLTGSTFRLLNELGKLSRDGVSKVETGGGRMEVKQGFVESLTIGPSNTAGSILAMRGMPTPWVWAFGLATPPRSTSPAKSST